MEHVHYLHSQHYHDTTTRFAEGGCYTKFQFFAAVDHILQHVIDRVLMDASAFGNDLSHFAPHLANKTCGAGPCLVPWIVGKDPVKISIVNCRPFKVVTLALATVVFSQRSSQRGEWLDFRTNPVPWFGAREIFHQLVNVFEFVQRGPTSIAAAPLRSRTQPYSKGFREVFRRMRLRVPRGEMQNVLAALWFRLVEVRIRLRERTKQLAMLAF